MPLEPSVKEPDEIVLSDFAADCHLPQTVEIVEGYDSLESDEFSWSQGEILNLHSLTEQTLVIARDQKGNDFAIPLSYPRKIFEIIPRNMVEDQCTPEPIKGAKLKTAREIVDWVTLPIYVRVQHGVAEAFEGTNKTPPVKFEGVFLLTEALKQKIFIVSTLHEMKLRVLKLPIDLAITICQREKTNPVPPILFSRICKLIDTEVDIGSMIMCGSRGDNSWFFDISEGIVSPTAIHDDGIYEEIRPHLPPRSPAGPKPVEQGNRSNNDVRYTKTPGHSQKTEKPFGTPAASREKKKNKPPVAQRPPSRKATRKSEMSNTSSKDSDSFRKPVFDLDSQTDYCQIEEILPNAPQSRKKAPSVKKTVPEERPGVDEASKPVLISSGQSRYAALVRDRQETADEVQGMSVKEVGECLKKLGLSKHVDRFAEELIDGVMLLELDDEMMQQLGVEKLQRRKLLMFIQRGYIPRQ